MRYYNFAFPLLLIVVASQLSANSSQRIWTDGVRKWRAAIALPIGAATAYAIYTRLAPFTPSFVDSPELRGFTRDWAMFVVLGGLSLGCVVLWVAAARAGARAFLFVFMPLAVGVSTFAVSHELRQRLVADVYDQAGIIAKNYLPRDDLAKVEIVGSELGGLYRSLFYLDNPQASLKAIPRDATFDLSELPADKEWALVIGNRLSAEDGGYRLPMNGFVLARKTNSDVVDFKHSAWPGVVSSARGLSNAEPWGTWSEGGATTLEFSAPLPEKFAVHLVAHAFGPNVGKEFVARVGDSAAKFTLGASDEERVLEFSNPTRSRTIEIDIPAPASPKALGMNGDERTLGIGFVELRVAPP
jgi:phosphoglycerol transferase